MKIFRQALGAFYVRNFSPIRPNRSSRYKVKIAEEIVGT